MSEIKDYFIVEAHPPFFYLSAISHNSVSKIIDIKKRLLFKDFPTLKENLKNKKEDLPIIISLNSKLAKTEFLFEKIIRSDRAQPLSEIELDDLLSQLIRRNLPASKIQVCNFNIDGHRTINPLGLKGEECEVYFNRTKTSEHFLSNKAMMIGEPGSLLTHLISQIKSSVRPFFLVTIFYDTAEVFMWRDGLISRYQIQPWGEKFFLSTLFGNLALDQEVARQVLERFSQNKVSPRLRGELDDFFKKEIDQFKNWFERIMTKEKINQIYFLPFFNLSFNQLKLNKGRKIIPINKDFVEKMLKFKVKSNEELFFALLLTELETISVDNFANKIIRRRLCWLNTNQLSAINGQER